MMFIKYREFGYMPLKQKIKCFIYEFFFGFVDLSLLDDL